MARGSRKVNVAERTGQGGRVQQLADRPVRRMPDGVSGVVYGGQVGCTVQWRTRSHNLTGRCHATMGASGRAEDSRYRSNLGAWCGGLRNLPMLTLGPPKWSR